MTHTCRFLPRLAALLVLVTIATASSALAAPKKKGAKPKPADSTDTAPAASSAPAATAAATAEPAPAPAPETTPPKTDAPAAGAAPAAESKTSPDVDSTNTAEDPNTRYYFLGLRYRGTIIPQFFESLFVDEGGTVYSNTFGAEIDMRKGGQSMIPWIIYQEYGMGETLFHQKGTTTDIAGNYTAVSSSLKALYLGLDELWSTPLDESHHWDFEFGFGVGIGIVFGDLINNWAQVDPTNSSPLKASTGLHYVACQAEGAPGTGCSKTDHQNATIAKVGGYKELNWFNGGSVPVIFPSISFPALGIRYKPIKQFETRLQVGFSITGFWFGLSADYGLEKAEDKSVKASTSLARMHDML